MLPANKKVKNYTFKKQIGKGNYSEVWKAIDKTSYKEYAIKIIDDDQIKANSKVLDLLQSEIKILKSINNINVVKLYDHFIQDGLHYLIMEYCDSGDLANYMKNQPNKCISEQEALGFFKQLLNGFKALHEINAMHRDFKLANILIHEGVLKIADLGFSKQANLAKTSLGTGAYMAPEIMEFKQYNNKVDIWSLGVSLYQMLYGVFPFFGFNDDELLMNMLQNKIDFNEKNIKISTELQNLIKNMLIVNPIKRINWIDIYNHELLNSEEKKQVGGLQGNVSKYMKKSDVEKEHQNLIFQKNKNFYKDHKNLEYFRKEEKNEGINKNSDESDDSDEETINRKRPNKKKSDKKDKVSPIKPNKNGIMKHNDVKNDDSSDDNEEKTLKPKKVIKKKIEDPDDSDDNNKNKQINSNRNVKDDINKNDDNSDDNEQTVKKNNMRKKKFEISDNHNINKPKPDNSKKTKENDKKNEDSSDDNEKTLERKKLTKKKFNDANHDEEKDEKNGKNDKNKDLSSKKQDNSKKNQNLPSNDKQNLDISDDNEETLKKNYMMNKGEAYEHNKTKVLATKALEFYDDDDKNEDTMLIKKPMKKLQNPPEFIPNPQKIIQMENKEIFKSNKNDMRYPSLDEINFEEMLIEKKKTLALLQTKYLHSRNIIAQHAKVLNDGLILNSNDNSIYIYFILLKRILYLSHEFSQIFEKKQNVLNEKFFEDFVSSRNFEEISTIFENERKIYQLYLDSLLVDIKGYETYENPLYLQLKGEFNNNVNNIEALFKEILIDSLCTGTMMVEGYNTEKEPGNLKKFAIHLIELADCYMYKENFSFDVNEDSGFDFDKYKILLENMSMDKIVELLQQKFAKFF